MIKLNTIFDIFLSTALNHGRRPFLHIPLSATKSYGDHEVNLTYSEALDLIIKRRSDYIAAGVRANTRVGLILENRADFFIHWIALNGLGVSIVPLNSEASSTDLAYIVDNSELILIVALKGFLLLATETIKTAKRKIPIVSVDDLRTLSLQKSISLQGPSKKSECALLYTSGSTGKPKGCILSNEYFIIMGQWYRDLGGLCAIREGEERLLTPLPLAHMNSLAAASMCMIMTGGCLIQLDRFHPKTWWKTVSESKATIIHYLGVMPAILLNMEAETTEQSHNVRFGFGAGVNPKHHEKFETRFQIPLIEAWSMTEVGGGAVVIANFEPRHVGSCCFGKPDAFMEWRIINDVEEDVDKGVPGEFLVRRAGPDPRQGFFSGYFGMIEETEKCWEGGWFHTGDVVRENSGGSLHFVDRKKSIIRRSGENIASLEVEAVLAQISGIKAVGVVPVADDLRGEEVFAALVLDDTMVGNQNLAQEIFNSAFKKLTYFKVPGYIAFVDSLPLTSSQKLQRSNLKALAKDLVERGEIYDLCSLKKRYYDPDEKDRMQG